MHSSTINVVCPCIPDLSSKCVHLPDQRRQRLPVVIHRAAAPPKSFGGVDLSLHKDSLGEADLRPQSVPRSFVRQGDERTLRGQGIRSMHTNQLRPTPRIVFAIRAQHSVIRTERQD